MTIIHIIVLLVLSVLWTIWGMRMLLFKAQGEPAEKHKKKGSIMILEHSVKHYQTRS